MIFPALSRRRFLAATGATAAGLFVGCSKEQPPADPDPTLPPPPAGDLTAFVGGNTRFAGDFLAAAGAGNRIVSPWGVAAVFGMVSHGARGATLDQMRKALHLPATEDAAAAGFAEVLRQVNAVRATGFTLDTANAVWGQKGFPWRPEYTARLKAGHGAAVNEADFKADAEAARRAINGWAERKTQNRIKDLIPSGDLDRDTRMVLANAVYFKADWKEKFEPGNTRTGPFTTTAGNKVDAKLMRQQDHFPYLEGDGFQAVELPYVGRRASMLVFLPTKPDGLPALEKTFPAKLTEWTGKPWQTEEVNLTLPRWRAETAVDLVPLLKGLGMSDVFDEKKADLSGMHTGGEPLFVSAARQKAFVDVNEEGTEAAAATFAGVKSAAAPAPKQIKTFRADHPFLYLIRHTPTGAILFAGRVEQP